MEQKTDTKLEDTLYTRIDGEPLRNCNVVNDIGPVDFFEALLNRAQDEGTSLWEKPSCTMRINGLEFLEIKLKYLPVVLVYKTKESTRVGISLEGEGPNDLTGYIALADGCVLITMMNEAQCQINGNISKKHVIEMSTTPRFSVQIANTHLEVELQDGFDEPVEAKNRFFGLQGYELAGHIDPVLQCTRIENGVNHVYQHWLESHGYLELRSQEYQSDIYCIDTKFVDEIMSKTLVLFHVGFAQDNQCLHYVLTGSELGLMAYTMKTPVDAPEQMVEFMKGYIEYVSPESLHKSSCVRGLLNIWSTYKPVVTVPRVHPLKFSRKGDSIDLATPFFDAGPHMSLMFQSSLGGNGVSAFPLSHWREDGWSEKNFCGIQFQELLHGFDDRTLSQFNERLARLGIQSSSLVLLAHPVALKAIPVRVGDNQVAYFNVARRDWSDVFGSAWHIILSRAWAAVARCLVSFAVKNYLAVPSFVMFAPEFADGDVVMHAASSTLFGVDSVSGSVAMDSAGGYDSENESGNRMNVARSSSKFEECAD